MDKLKKFLQNKPVFLLLLPVFFVLHGFTENFDAVPVKDAFYLFLLYLIATAVIFCLSWLLYRNRAKAAIFAFFVMAFHFFFGGLQDELKKLFDEALFTRYSFMLPFFFMAFILVFFLVKRSKQFTQLHLYLTILLLALTLIDIGWLTEKVFSRKAGAKATQPVVAGNCNTCIKPDIYLLLFDEYSSSSAMRELWNFDNSDLDSFLLQKGFQIQPNSRSNYNFTPFSMASLLNMEYLTIPESKACTVKDYSRCYDLIKTNQVCTFLQAQGYKIVNYSIFDLQQNPSPVTEDFLPLKTKLITSQTFLSRVEKDLLYHLLVGKFEVPWLTRNIIYTTYYNNEKIIGATLKESRSESNAPKFIYSHIEMPHPPFYYHGADRQTDKQTLLRDNINLSVAAYLGYVPRTNAVIKQLVDSIMTNARRPHVIILLGDHGFRTKQPEPYHFRNQNAVYISVENKAAFYPGITNVNEFRVLFNGLFHTSYPLLKDSTSFLEDR